MTVQTEVPADGLRVRSAPIEDASEHDTRELIELLTSSLPDSSPHTVWDLPWTWSNYRVIRDEDDRIVAAAALVELDAHRVEIRGLTVTREARGQRLASRLMIDALSRADDLGRETVCMTRKPGFFERFGFHCTVPMWLPEHRWTPAPRPEAPRIAMRRPIAAGAAA